MFKKLSKEFPFSLDDQRSKKNQIPCLGDCTFISQHYGQVAKMLSLERSLSIMVLLMSKKAMNHTAICSSFALLWPKFGQKLLKFFIGLRQPLITLSIGFIHYLLTILSRLTKNKFATVSSQLFCGRFAKKEMLEFFNALSNLPRRFYS